MPPSSYEIADLMPKVAPACEHGRLLLFAMRRLASCGLNDAHAANAFLTAFGRSFRRPLLLLRAFMAEVSRISHRRILVAPCCCPRMTEAEALLLETVIAARSAPRETHDRLATMLGVRHCLGALSSAQALDLAFEDLGRPLGENASSLAAGVTFPDGAGIADGPIDQAGAHHDREQ